MRGHRLGARFTPKSDAVSELRRVCVCVCVCVLCLLVRVQRARTHRDIYIALQDASTQLFEASSCMLFVTEGVFVVTPIFMCT